MSTVAELPVSVPGTTQQVAEALVYVIGWPPAVTVGLPASTVPICAKGAKNGSLGCRPTCGGVAWPVVSATATGVPPTRTVATTPWTSGAWNGSPGAGIGAPVGEGTKWFGHVPLIASPATTAG